MLRITERMPALSYRDFRLYIMGQVVSVAGSWIQALAISWTIYHLTQSAMLLGWAAFLMQGPQLVLTPFAGVWIDRFDRRKLFLAIQLINAGAAFSLALLSLSGLLSAPSLLAASTLLGILNSFDTPLRQSSLFYLIGDKKHLASAISLNASVFTMGRFLGPLIAGILISTFSNTLCFFINALSFAGLIYAICQIKGEFPSHLLSPSKTMSVLREGVLLAWNRPDIRSAFGLLATVNLCGSAGLVLAPVLASGHLGGGSEVLGWLLGMAGAGALFGAAFLSANGRSDGLRKLLMLAPWFSLFGLGLIATSQNLWLTLTGMFLIGFGIALTNVCTNAHIQGVVTEHLLSRIISLFAAIRFGMDALGGLIAGWIASVLCVQQALFMATIFGLAIVFYIELWMSRSYR